MNPFWNTFAAIFGVVIFIIFILNCKGFLRDYKIIKELVRPNQVLPIPIAYGEEVENITEDLEVIYVS